MSGVHSGPNPSPGLGVARCLREAYPSARLIGVDYSPRSSGLHSDLFDDILVNPPWPEIDLPTHRGAIDRLLGPETFWLSCLDLEVVWLAEEGISGGRVLVPPATSLPAVAKPAFRAGRRLGVRVPASVRAIRSDWDLHAFCRRHGWRVWLKGPHYDARRVADWPGFGRARQELAAIWRTENLVLQAHVAGREGSLAYCAWRGRLLDCVLMEKRDQTEQGKTWAGRVVEVPALLRSALARVLRDLRWTGGGEIECVRDREGVLNVIDWNPRFPAWIYGAAIAGRNLPALLLQAAGAGPRREVPAASAEFARVVIEIPVRSSLPLLPSAPGDAWDEGAGKHPSGMPDLAARMGSNPERTVRDPPEVSDLMIRSLPRRFLGRIRTPTRLLLAGVLAERIRRLRMASDDAGREGVALAFAYSVKTNPDPRVLRAVANAGFLAEVIGPAESRHALASGFEPERLVVNGPLGHLVRTPAARPLHAWFADSLDALEARRATGRPAAHYVGIRLRPPGVTSRFGVDLDDPACFTRLVEILARFPAEQKLGLHFHVPSDVVGTRAWWHLSQGVLAWASAVARSVERPIACLDVGGGWFPDDFEREFLPRVRDLLAEAKRRLPGLECVLAEPGRAIIQPAMALVTRVVEVRRAPGERREAVVDAGISDLPMGPNHAHRMLMNADGNGWRPIAGGRDRILGRLCMEQDILADGVLLSDGLRPGQAILFLDAGGYDASRAYEFGRGRRHDA